jgi:electron transport complex protein RnfG
MIFRLTTFGLITSLFVGVIYVITQPLIVESKEQARLEQLYALAKPLLATGEIEASTTQILPSGAPPTLTNPIEVTAITNATAQVGTVIPFRSTEGYSGTIHMLMALDDRQRIVGVRVVDHKETPGLGDKIDTRKSDWILQFNGLSYGDLSPSDWAIDKDGGRFDSFTGATITPRAVVNALKETLNYLDANPQILETKQ